MGAFLIVLAAAGATSVAAFHDRHLEFRRPEGSVGTLEPVALAQAGGGGG